MTTEAVLTCLAIGIIGTILGVDMWVCGLSAGMYAYFYAAVAEGES